MSSNNGKSGYQKFFQDARKSADSGAKPLTSKSSAARSSEKSQNDMRMNARSENRASDAKSAMTPEQLVRAHLEERVKSRRQDRMTARSSVTRRRSAPVFAISMLLCALGAGVAGYHNPTILDDIQIPVIPGLPGIKLGFFGTAEAKEESKAEKNSDAPKTNGKIGEASNEGASATSTVAANSAGAETSSKTTTGGEETPDLKQWSTEELSFFKRLNERKTELDRREAEIVKLEEELQKQRNGIEEKIKQLETMRKQISETLKGRVEQDQEKVAKLVDVYSNMKPTQASKVIETLNEDLAVTILDRMKKKNAAEILNTMSAAKARRLSEMLTGYRQPAAEKSESTTP